MQGLQLPNEAKLTVVNTGAAAGQTTVTSSPVDMAGFDSVMFVISLGTQVGGAVITATAEQSTTSGGTYAPIVDAISGANAAETVTDVAGNSDNGVIVIDVFRPLQEFVECVVARATQNSVINNIIAFQYNAKRKPVTQDASILATGSFVGS